MINYSKLDDYVNDFKTEIDRLWAECEQKKVSPYKLQNIIHAYRQNLLTQGTLKGSDDVNKKLLEIEEEFMRNKLRPKLFLSSINGDFSCGPR
jgi:hypothetical protein